jgi:heme/copper-type cytochrome/quinol oxidase subunit 4
VAPMTIVIAVLAVIGIIWITVDLHHKDRQ